MKNKVTSSPTLDDVLPEESGVAMLARKRILDENRSLQSAYRSIGLETGSNLLFTGIALYSTMDHESIIGAWKAAALVYVPQVYDVALGHYRRYQLGSCLENYKHKGDSKEFDKVGLALRGGFPQYDEKHSDSVALSAIRDMTHLLPGVFQRIPKSPLNPYSWGVLGSVPFYLWLNVVEAKNTASDIFNAAFNKAAKPDPNEYSFARNHDRQTKRVIQTRMSGEKDVEPLEMPANPHRLADNLRHIKTDKLLERGKILASVCGVYGVYDFLCHVYPQTQQHIVNSIQLANTENIALAGAWALVAAMGAGAAQHFLEDRSNIQTKLQSHQALAARNHGATIILWDTIETLRELIEQYEHEKDPERMIDLMHEIAETAKNIDRSALDTHIREYVDTLIERLQPETHGQNNQRPAPEIPS